VTTLNQILGVRKGVNSTAGKRFTEIHRDTLKAQLVNGLSRTYTPKDDDGDVLPGEFQRVQIKVDDLIEDLVKVLARQIDVNATVDAANQEAVADLDFGGAPIPNVPVTTLMWLEKQLTEIKAFIDKLPVLDPSVSWDWDAQAGIYKSDVVTTHRTSKVAKPIVLFPATAQHAAQTQLITEDVITGYWNSQRLSSALPADTIRGMQDRLNILKEAVVVAREKANTTPVTNVTMGEALLTFVFGV